MKVVIITLASFILIGCSTNSKKEIHPQEESPKFLTEKEQKSLIALGQLWGFLKYHHPAVAKGQYDWDMEFINLVPSILDAQDETKWKKQLDDWLNSFPPIPENPDKKLPELEAKTKPDYGELFNTDYFASETIEKIKYILDNATISFNHYIEIDKFYGRITFTNEPDYREQLYPDLFYRLLALFKHWNIVNFFFPYRELCDQKWSDVLIEMLPEYFYAENMEQYIFAGLKLSTKIDDSHGFWGPYNAIFSLREGFLNPCFEVRFIEDKLVVTEYTGEDKYTKENIKIGDVITAINGETIEEIIKRMLPYTSGSNYPVKLREISAKITKGNSINIMITILRDNKKFDIQLPCYDTRLLNRPNYYNPLPEEEGYQILSNNIGYVFASSCKEEEREEGIKKVLDGTKGLIIDMRCYPDDYISLSFLPFLPHTSKKFSLISYANVAYPGYFFIVNNGEHPNHNTNQENLYKNKIVVIVNEYTQSSAEDNVLVFQLATNVTVIGSTTAAADGKVTYFTLPGGIVTRMTGLGVYYPDGSDLHRTGIKIDEVIKPTIAGIINGRDELLERAIEIIENDNKINGNL